MLERMTEERRKAREERKKKAQEGKLKVMPCLHLLRSSYNLFVYDFLYDFSAS